MNDVGFAESRTMLTAFRKAFQNYKSGLDRVLADFPQKLEAAGFGAEAHADMLRHYDQGMVKARSVLEENMELERQTLEIMVSIIELLESRRPYWQAIDGQFVFQDTRDLERFNGYLASMEQNAKRQDELQRNSQKQSNANLEAIKAMLPE